MINMESFQVCLDLKTVECSVSGSVLGLEFIEKYKELTQKFINFCTERCGICTSGGFDWRVGNRYDSTQQDLDNKGDKADGYGETVICDAIQCEESIDKNSEVEQWAVSKTISRKIEDKKSQPDREKNEAFGPNSYIICENGHETRGKITWVKNEIDNLGEVIQKRNSTNTQSSHCDNSSEENMGSNEFGEETYTEVITGPVTCGKQQSRSFNSSNQNVNRRTVRSKDRNASTDNKYGNDVELKSMSSDIIDDDTLKNMSNCNSSKNENNHDHNSHDNGDNDDTSSNHNDRHDYDSKEQVSKHLCQICDSFFRSKRALKNHMLEHSDKPSLNCSLCKKQLCNQKVLSQHYRNIHCKHYCKLCLSIYGTRSDFVDHRIKGQCVKDMLGAQYLCKLCGIFSKHTSTLYRHYMIVHKMKVSICRFCGESFSLRKELVNHLATQHKEVFCCDICSENFEVQKLFHEHLRSKHSEKVLACNQCSFVSLSKDVLQKHEAEHANSSSYSCKHCGKCFKGKKGLNTHLIIHTTARPYQCETCGICFKLRHNLYSHTRTHKQEKNYKCTSCLKEFRSSDGLKNHQINHHMNENDLKSFKNKIYTCEHCGKMTGQKHVHVRHVRSHTGEKPFECTDCNNTFTNLSSLNSHRKRHGQKSEMCDICGISFCEKSKYKRHLNSKKHKANLARFTSKESKSDSQAVVSDVHNSVLVINREQTEIPSNSASTYIIIPQFSGNSF